MAYDEGLAAIMRDDLEGRPTITERKMFGGLAFMLNGNMVAGVHKDGAMARVGKEAMDEAMAIEGVGPMEFTGRPMGGMVSMDADLMADDARRCRIMGMAIAHAESLPPK